VKKLLIGAFIVFSTSSAYAGGGATPYNGKAIDPASLLKDPAEAALLQKVIDEDIAKGRLCYLPNVGISPLGATATYEGKTVRCERTLTMTQEDHLVPGRAEWVAVKE
jgi:hypothetical protein